MRFLTLVFLLISTPAFGSDVTKDQNLPTFGDAISGTVSLEQERELGQDFLRMLRAQAPTVDDPVLQDYVEHLTYKLVTNSQLKDRRLDLVVIDSPILNAFAVPGGVIGVHDGLFNYAQSEHEISAILAHEIAHLSQRHFARGVEAGRKTAAINLGGLLASIVLMTTVGTDAGLAALTAVQGVSVSQQLRHSRARESEADRIGINTLVETEMDPRAMAYMFERLERSTRYDADKMPEFLRTHPVTRSRIADAYNQSNRYTQKDYPLSVDFHMMKARVKARQASVAGDVIPAFRAGLNHEEPVIRDANAYGLVLALTDGNQFDEAMQFLRPLQETYPDKIALVIAEASVHQRAERFEVAQEVLETALDISPSNYPLTMAYAQLLMNIYQAEKAQQLLTAQTSERENDEYLWYHLAEAAGLADDIPSVHWARAEYFVLNGNYDQALKQLEYALPLVRANFQFNAKVKQRITEIWELKNKSGITS